MKEEIEPESPPAIILEEPCALKWRNFEKSLLHAALFWRLAFSRFSCLHLVTLLNIYCPGCKGAEIALPFFQ